MTGGALRQAGIVAAGCLWTLDHHVERLAEDHTHAQLLATGLAGLPGITLDSDTVETNIVVFGVANAPRLCQRLEAEHGVRMGALEDDLVRAIHSERTRRRKTRRTVRGDPAP